MSCRYRAQRIADVVVRLPGSPHGPAYARNRSFEFTRGEYVAFIDADVCVHRDTLARFVLVLSREPDVSDVAARSDKAGGRALRDERCEVD